MTAGGFHADTGRLGERSKDFEGHARRAEEVAKALRTALESTGTPWGSDEVGRSFAAAHGSAASDTLAALGGLGGELGTLGGKFAEAARAYRAGDDSAVDDLSALGGERPES